MLPVGHLAGSELPDDDGFVYFDEKDGTYLDHCAIGLVQRSDELGHGISSYTVDACLESVQDLEFDNAACLCCGIRRIAMASWRRHSIRRCMPHGPSPRTAKLIAGNGAEGERRILGRDAPDAVGVLNLHSGQAPDRLRAPGTAGDAYPELSSGPAPARRPARERRGRADPCDPGRRAVGGYGCPERPRPGLGHHAE